MFHAEDVNFYALNDQCTHKVVVQDGAVMLYPNCPVAAQV
ncbi:MAG: hypothetical protein ABWX68_04840 [Arthrobacter sp.]